MSSCLCTCAGSAVAPSLGLPARGCLRRTLHTRPCSSVESAARAQSPIHRPPAAGKDQRLVMVWTDVESSTELWEWNNALMMQSLDTHDTIIRAGLSKYALPCSRAHAACLLQHMHRIRHTACWSGGLPHHATTALWMRGCSALRGSCTSPW